MHLQIGRVIQKVALISFTLSLFSQMSASTPEKKIVVRGSDAMLSLAMRWSNLLSTNGSHISLDVNGGGPAAGIKLLAAKRTDIAQLPRKLSQAEKSILGGGSAEFPVALESVVVYVHKSNPVVQLSIQQLKEIYTGRITSWKSIDGRDAPINLYSTESLVGGSLFFREVVLGSEEFDTVMQGFSNTKRMLETLARDPNGIGFGDLEAGPSAKPVRIAKGSNFASVEPTFESIRSINYPLSRYLYWVVLTPLSPDMTRLCDWVESQQGQLVVEAAGYYPLNSDDRSRATGTIHGGGR